MKRKSFIKTTALGLGAIFQMPFTGQRFPASEIGEAFNDDAPAEVLYDAIIIGGSYAGLSAAMGLGRCRRKVLMIDAGMPRNRTSPQANNLFSRDGQNPAEIREEAKAQLGQYKEYLARVEGMVVEVEKKDDSFSVSHENGNTFTGQNVIFAGGVTDNLQDIDGLEELWGRGVYHCPYCHGWENRDKKTVVIGSGTSALSLASTITNWTDDITYYSQGVPVDLPDDTRRLVSSLGITIEHGTVKQISKNGSGIQIHLDDATAPLLFEACYAPGRITANSRLAEALGCSLRANGAVEVNEQYLSNVEGVYAIGDICSRTNGQVIHAAYSGTVVAAAVNRVFLDKKFSS
ncbi:MAG: NAD(P)/FAD-dependent oxidoreductase [Balneolia bacterium]|nr:NAD(P)/FAD-dependent oxidoreductase [Balneolia bacterium]